MIINYESLEIDLSHFWTFNWYYVIGILLSATGVTIAYKNYKKRNKPNDNIPITSFSPTINPTISPSISSANTNNVTLNFGNQDAERHHPQTLQGSEDGFERYKKLTNILFIDDDTKFKVVNILINTGWINTKSIVDLNTYDENILVKSNIVFVDIQGVGKLLHCKDEGLSLALNIKDKYPNKKVVIYSAIESHKVFHEAISKVDFLLSKDAEPYEFISLIEKYCKEIGL